ncbi:MAG: hypothetical protein J5967_01325, partial [Oscillospiraceae bacterium]|nr:hypothetical protein [Oscillospiraceae bacterium]
MARKNLITTLYAGAFTKRGVKLYGGIALAAIVIFAVIYFNTQMRPVDLLSRFEADTQPVQARIVRYDFDQNKTELILEDQEAVSALWQAMETSKVRYVSYLSAASVPAGGYYYEVSLFDDAAAGGETATWDDVMDLISQMPEVQDASEQLSQLDEDDLPIILAVIGGVVG